MTELEVEKFIIYTNRIISNLKKAPNRQYLRDHLLGKINQLNEYYNTILDVVELITDEKQQKFALSGIRLVFAEAKDLLINRLANAKTYYSFKLVALVCLATVKFEKLLKKNKNDFGIGHDKACVIPCRALRRGQH